MEFNRLMLRILRIIFMGIALLQLVGGFMEVKSTAETLADPKLVGRAVLPATTFAPGPTSGAQIGSGLINGQEVPFVNKQPVQGFSGIVNKGDGTFLVVSDNGFGNLENSVDYNLRVYIIRPDFKTQQGGSGVISVEGFFELHDPDKHVPFAITSHFTEKRVLTGADFDLESIQQAPDGTLWFGDEFGPFLLHTDIHGKLLEPPVPLPDFDNPGKEIRSPQNPFNEEASAVRIMNAVKTHATLHGNNKVPVVSPWHLMLDDGNPHTFVDHRKNPPADSGLITASSEIFSILSLQRAGYPILTWTVNNKDRMLELMRLGVNGIISDRPDLLKQAVEEFDANGDGKPGDFLDTDGLIDFERFDAQGHRGSRGLRPENTLPAMEVALDVLISTLEVDTGITLDGVPVLSHDPQVRATKCRRAEDALYTKTNEMLVKDLTVARLQTTFICDRLLPDYPEQTNDLSLSPVSVAFAAHYHLIHPYVMPTLQQLFDFVDFYGEYYRSGSGKSHSDAERRWKNAQRVRFNIETKVNPRAEFSTQTIEARSFAQAIAKVIETNNLQERVSIQSFDFRTLLFMQEEFPQIQTVYLFGDFPIFSDPTISGSGDGTNLQDENDRNTPWLAGLFWPYRITRLSHPFRAQQSGGFEGIGQIVGHTPRLLPLLEKPLLDGEDDMLFIYEFDLTRKRYTGTHYRYQLHPYSQFASEFILLDERRGLAIERDETQGDLNGFKVIYQIELPEAGGLVKKTLAVNLLRIEDPFGISLPGQPGDIGIGRNFAFPFITPEAVVVFDHQKIGVLNDNNFPFTIGRHVGTKQPDDTEFIIIQFDQSLRDNK